jgi:leucine-rich repeat protein SHOC2
MEQAELEQIIEKARIDRLSKLSLKNSQIAILPESIIGLGHYLTHLYLDENNLTSLPENIGNLFILKELNLANNQLNDLPTSISMLSNLTYLDLNGNPLADLSILQALPTLEYIRFLDVDLPRRYWTHLVAWQSEWLLDEDNTEIRRMLIEQLGYEKICQNLGSVDVDKWREYTLLKIDHAEIIYDEGYPVETEPMVLLKMTCPSTAHIHILRVPPEMTSAEAAITWVNHGIHPDEFAIQT